MRAAQILRSFAVAILVLNAIATVVAIVVNLPSQFGIVGTDAAEEFLTSGTAISAPLIPVVSLLIIVATVRRRDAWRWVGIAAGYFTAISVAIGGYGELVAEPTADTPKAVLVASGIVFLTIAFALVVLTTVTAISLRRHNSASSTSLPVDGEPS